VLDNDFERKNSKNSKKSNDTNGKITNNKAKSQRIKEDDIELEFEDDPRAMGSGRQ
jgi:hypothetical protein